MPTQNEIRQPRPKLRSPNALMSTIGSSTVNTRQKKATAETTPIPEQTATQGSSSPPRVTRHPLSCRPPPEQLSERAKDPRHEDQAPPVETVEQLEIRLIEI